MSAGNGFKRGSDSHLQFRDTCGKRRNINLILDVYSYLKCTVYDKLLKPRQSFRTPCISNPPFSSPTWLSYPFTAYSKQSVIAQLTLKLPHWMESDSTCPCTSLNMLHVWETRKMRYTSEFMQHTNFWAMHRFSETWRNSICISHTVRVILTTAATN